MANVFICPLIKPDLCFMRQRARAGGCLARRDDRDRCVIAQSKTDVFPSFVKASRSPLTLSNAFDNGIDDEGSDGGARWTGAISVSRRLDVCARADRRRMMFGDTYYYLMVLATLSRVRAPHNAPLPVSPHLFRLAIRSPALGRVFGPTRGSLSRPDIGRGLFTNVDLTLASSG